MAVIVAGVALADNITQNHASVWLASVAYR